MRLCSKFDLVPRAWAFWTHEDARPLVSLKMATLFWMLEPDEARKFAAEIAAAADEAEARRPTDTAA
jgi:hypothetical protein